MRNITQEELDKIIEQHKHWLNEDCEGWEGMKANLSGSNLSYCNLRGSDLSYCDLSDANLHGCNLSYCDLSDANLHDCDLSDANLHGCNLSYCNLRDANLHDCDLSDAEKMRIGRILTEPLKGYKKTKEGVVITAEIPAGAIVFCINGKKCRTNRAKITDMEGREILHSQYDNSFEYRLGQEIEIKDFNLMYNVECASGFHFFENKEDADRY